MSKIMQNLVVLMEPSKNAYETPLKAGNMILNRFCIDEDAAFELSGVNYLTKSHNKMLDPKWKSYFELEVERKVKGIELSFLPSYLILRHLIYMDY